MAFPDLLVYPVDAAKIFKPLRLSCFTSFLFQFPLPSAINLSHTFKNQYFGGPLFFFLSSHSHPGISLRKSSKKKSAPLSHICFHEKLPMVSQFCIQMSMHRIHTLVKTTFLPKTCHTSFSLPIFSRSLAWLWCLFFIPLLEYHSHSTSGL